MYYGTSHGTEGFLITLYFGAFNGNSFSPIYLCSLVSEVNKFSLNLSVYWCF
jgi:hypothetical protein